MQNALKNQREKILNNSEWKYVLMQVGQAPTEELDSIRKLVKLTNCQTQESKVIVMSDHLVEQAKNNDQQAIEKFLARKVNLAPEGCQIFMEISDKKFD